MRGTQLALYLKKKKKKKAADNEEYTGNLFTIPKTHNSSAISFVITFGLL